MNPLRLTATDRVLVLAPHPDDESIACGGLLLAARAAGAARCVVTLTDGDNNPWPQRWIEKRWRIDTAARSRWGARRRAESHAALDVLGVAAENRVFLGFPDTALTALLMRDTQRLLAPLRERIAAFRPTLVAFPTLGDRHPDHSAAHIAMRFALPGSGISPQSLVYLVHGTDSAPMEYLLESTPAQRDLKREAIACHRTQMALSDKRFLAFAARAEVYGDAASTQKLEFAVTGKLIPCPSEISLELRARKRFLPGNRRALILLGGASGETHAWHLALPARGRSGEVREARDGRLVATAEWREETDAWTLALPFAPRGAGFIKFTERRPGWAIYDRHGWQAIGNLE